MIVFRHVVVSGFACPDSLWWYQASGHQVEQVVPNGRRSLFVLSDSRLSKEKQAELVILVVLVVLVSLGGQQVSREAG